MSTNYNTPLGTRYKPEVSAIWSKEHHISLMVDVWVHGHNQMVGSLFPKELAQERMLDNRFQLALPTVKQELYDLADSYEGSFQHETVAILEAVKEVLYKNTPTLFHVGLTSSDIQDQVVLAQQIESLIHLGARVERLLVGMSLNARQGNYYQELIGRTHLQPAEPVTLLHRMNLFAHDLRNWHDQATFTLNTVLSPYLRVMTGSVGTQTNIVAMMQSVSSQSYLIPFNSARPKSQTLPRMLDVHYAQVLDSLAAILHKFALDFRVESGFGSIVEGASKNRVGSSAMPYKKNPITAENICSLSRHVHHLIGDAWDNASQQILERTLDDSANRRFWIPESTQLTDHILTKTEILVGDLANIAETPASVWSDIWLASRQQTLNQLTKYFLDSGHVTFKPNLHPDDDFLVHVRAQGMTQLGFLPGKYTKTFCNTSFTWPHQPSCSWKGDKYE